MPPFARLLSRHLLVNRNRNILAANPGRDARRLSSAPPVRSLRHRAAMSLMSWKCDVEVSVDFEQFFSIGRTLSFYRIPVIASISPPAGRLWWRRASPVFGTGFLSDISAASPSCRLAT